MIDQVKKLTSTVEAGQAFDIIDTALKEDFSAYQQRTIRAYRKSVATREYFINFIQNKESIILGAYDGGKLVGFIALKIEYGGVLYVDWLAVSKAFRQQGIGTKLLQEAEKWGRENKYHCLYLYTETPQNIEFYEKKGFSFVGTLKSFWFGEDEHLMTKNIAAKPFEEIFSK